MNTCTHRTNSVRLACYLFLFLTSRQIVLLSFSPCCSHTHTHTRTHARTHVYTSRILFLTGAYSPSAREAACDGFYSPGRLPVPSKRSHSQHGASVSGRMTLETIHIHLNNIGVSGYRGIRVSGYYTSHLPPPPP